MDARAPPKMQQVVWLHCSPQRMVEEARVVEWDYPMDFQKSERKLKQNALESSQKVEEEEAPEFHHHQNHDSWEERGALASHVPFPCYTDGEDDLQ